MYFEASSFNHGSDDVFVSSERTDIHQISIFTFYYNRYSISTNEFKKSMCMFRTQILLEDNTWSTQNNIPKIDRISNSSTQCKKLSLNFTVENSGIKLIYDQAVTPPVDICFSKIEMTLAI